MNEYTELDDVIGSSLKELVDYLRNVIWYGRERELVSLFVLGHLVPRCNKDEVISDPAQIGIEVAVPQLPSSGGKIRKSDVCKDVVVWPRPRMTCWESSEGLQNYPLSVLEWKSFNPQDSPGDITRKRREYDNDIEWLIETSKRADSFVGYAILLDQKKDIRLSAARVRSGKTNRGWLVY